MTPEELLDGVRAGDQHRGGIRCLRLLRLMPPEFDRLRREVDDLIDTGLPSTVRVEGHVTSWTRPYGTVQQFSLFNRSGRYDDFRDDHDASRTGKAFVDPARRPGLAALFAIFPTAVNFRVNVLRGVSGLSPHEEHVFVRLESGAIVPRLRLHLPVHTTDEAVLVLDGDVHHLEPAVVHLVNHGCVHAAANPSSTARVHLVWDVLLDRPLAELLVGAAPSPSPLRRIPPDARCPVPLRRMRMGSPRRLPPALGAAEVARVRLE